MCNAYTSKLVGVASLVSDATFKIGQNFLSDHGVHGVKKLNLIELAQKIMLVGLVSHACTPILVSVASLVLEIKLAF